MSSALREDFRREQVSPTLHLETASDDTRGLRASAGEVVSALIAAHAAPQPRGVETNADAGQPSAPPSVDELTESWRQLEALADFPQIQEIIRRAIRRRWIRVSVNPAGEIQIRVRKKCRYGPLFAPGAF